MIRKINNRQKRDKLIDGYFNQNWCCDYDEVKNAVFDTINDLEEANDTKVIKIEKLKEENKQLKRDKNIMQKYLQLIADIGYDYDGYNDVENLKALIDELCKYALCGIKLDDKSIISSSCEKYYNILGEEILGDKE